MGKGHRSKKLGVAMLFAGMCGGAVHAQTCTTQAAMVPADRSVLAEAVIAIGNAVKVANSDGVKNVSAAIIASNFSGTESLVRSTAPKLASETLHVTQLYMLDATSRKAGDTSNADFNCALKGTSSETDFSIGGLPPGMFAFAMVEASGGDHPYLLSMMMQKEGAAWKLAGFYPKARAVGGHDGLWYWNAAREQAANKHGLMAWLYYAQAEALLQPAPFIDTTNLDKLRTEQRAAVPPELANGLSASSPMVVKLADGSAAQVTSLGNELVDDDKSVRLMVHVVGSGTDNVAIRAKSEATAHALVAAYPELKQAYSSVFVVADTPQGGAPVVSLPMSQIK